MEEITEESIEEFNGFAGCSLEGLPTLPVEEDFHDLEEKKVNRKSVFWRRPATKVYADNFGFSVNGYQSMIDYLDEKDSGCSVDKSEVHLPYLEERCMRKYSSQKPFKLYTNRDIDKFIAKGEKIRTQIRQNDAIGRSNVFRRTHTNWSMTKKYVQLVKNSYICDFRKLHCNKDLIKYPLPRVFVSPPVSDLPKNILSPVIANIIYSDMGSENFLATFVRNRLDHENEMAARKERLKVLDDEYEQTLKKLAFTVDRIGQRVDPAPQIISPHGIVYYPQDMIDVADDLVQYNRVRRQQDLYRLARGVNAVLDRGPKYRPDPLDLEVDEAYRNNPTRIAIAKRNAEAALLARNRANTNPANYEETDIDQLRYRYLNKKPQGQFVVELEPPRRARKQQQEDVISDVQTRIMNRARELGGVSSELRRINNRARFVNTVSPRPDTGAIDLRVPPSRTERNILNMAKSLAYSGKAVRQYDVDEEIDEPVSNLNTYATKKYCTRELDRPILEVPSDSSMVRDAAMRARNRNTLLGN